MTFTEPSLNWANPLVKGDRRFVNHHIGANNPPGTSAHLHLTSPQLALPGEAEVLQNE